MKKIISAMVLIIISLPMSVSSAAANTTATADSYGRVLNQNTYLYNSATTVSPCFLIPETYYVKILRDDGDFVFVQYQQNLAPYYKSISGYCKKSDLYLCDYIPETPYLDYSITVGNNTKGYATSALGAYDYLLNTGNPVVYYGKMRINNVLFYYVLAHGEYRCYISSADCEPLNYTLNTDPLPTPEPDPGDNQIVIPPKNTETQTPAETDSKLKIVLVLVIAVPALIATAFLFRPQKKTNPPAAKYYYDEQEYE